jgi:hypothetical protein
MKKTIFCTLAIFALIFLMPGRTALSQPSSATTSTGGTALGPGGNNQSKSSPNKDGKDNADKGKEQPNTIDGFQTKDLWREGARVIQMTGQFQAASDSIQFTSSDGKLQIIAIQNLMLQRVHQTITETADVKDHNWVINGIITEYRNANFIILTHAVLKSKDVKKELVLNKVTEPKPLVKP